MDSIRDFIKDEVEFFKSLVDKVILEKLEYVNLIEDLFFKQLKLQEIIYKEYIVYFEIFVGDFCGNFFIIDGGGLFVVCSLEIKFILEIIKFNLLKYRFG